MRCRYGRIADCVGNVPYILGADFSLLVGEIIQMFFRILHDLAHHSDRLNRVMPHRRFTGQHHRIGSVINGIGHIRNFRPGRPRVAYHGIQHLGGRNNHLACLVAFADQHFLDIGNLLCRYLNAHIAAGHHHAVAGFNNLIHILNPLRILDLGYDLHRGTAFFYNLPDFSDGICISYKRSGDEVKSSLNSKPDIIFILVGQRRKFDFDIGNVNALLLSQLTAVSYLTDNFPSLYLGHIEFNQSVVNQDFVAFFHILGKSLIINISSLIIPNYLFRRENICFTLL